MNVYKIVAICLLLGSLVFFGQVGQINAAKIDNLSLQNGIINPGGEGAVPYFAQSFKAPQEFAQSLSFVIGTAGQPNNSKFRVLLVETAEGSGIPGFGVHPTEVLFESETIELQDNLSQSLLTVDLDNVALVRGVTYAWMLDFIVAFDGLEDQAFLGTQYTSLPDTTAYLDGHQFHWFNAFAATGDRSTDFNNVSAWIASPGPTSSPPADSDLVFRMTFAEQPIPRPEPVLPVLTTPWPPFECNLVADNPVIHQGEALGLQATGTNYTSDAGSLLFATKVRLPNGNMYPSSGYLFGPFSFSLGPYQSKSKHLWQAIPPNAPLGTYTYYGYLGNYGTGIYDQCTFTFEVIEYHQNCTACHQ